jgi:cell division initiation protein
MIAPHELKNKAFNKAVRGYVMSEVDDYIDFLIDKYTEVYRKNADLESELHKTKVKYSELHHDEDSIRAVIVKAQKLGENIVSQARVEADKIVEASRETCRRNVEEAEKKIEESLKEADRIRTLCEAFRQKLYDEYLEHLKSLKDMNLALDLTAGAALSDKVEAKTDEQIEKAKEKLDTIRSDENETIIV